MSKAVDGNDWAVCWRLLDVEERVAELITVGVQEVNGTCRKGEEEEEEEEEMSAQLKQTHERPRRQYEGVSGDKRTQTAIQLSGRDL